MTDYSCYGIKTLNEFLKRIIVRISISPVSEERRELMEEYKKIKREIEKKESEK